MRFSFSLITLSVFTLVSCAQGGTLAPEEVLSKSSVANSGLRSARIQMNASLSTESGSANAMDGSLNVTGNMQEGGKQLDVLFASNGKVGTEPQTMSWKTSGRLIVLSQNETYVQLQELEMEPTMTMFSIDPLTTTLQTWFTLPSPNTPSTSLTPDPHFLRLQSEVVRVTKNHGIVPLNGKKAYHYTVSIDRDRLTAYLIKISNPNTLQANEQLLAQLKQYEATGEMWIDSETFILSKVVWTINDAKNPDSTASLSMSVEDVGVDVTITAPAVSQPFSVTPVSATYLNDVQ